MASKTIVELIDDLDQKPIKRGEGETVNFEFEGVAYTIDLSKANATKLRKTLSPYMNAARTVGGSRDGKRQRGRNATPDYSAKAVRAWAASHGLKVPARGRIPQAVVAQFHAAGN